MFSGLVKTSDKMRIISAELTINQKCGGVICIFKKFYWRFFSQFLAVN